MPFTLISIPYFKLQLIFNFSMKQKQLAPSLRIPMKYMYLSVPIGFSLMALHAIDEVIQIIAKKGGEK